MNKETENIIEEVANCINELKVPVKDALNEFKSIHTPYAPSFISFSEDGGIPAFVVIDGKGYCIKSYKTSVEATGTVVLICKYTENKITGDSVIITKDTEFVYNSSKYSIKTLYKLFDQGVYKLVFILEPKFRDVIL